MSPVAAAVIAAAAALAGVVVTEVLTLIGIARRSRAERSIERDRAVVQGLRAATEQLSLLHTVLEEVSRSDIVDSSEAGRMSAAESAFLGACDQTADDTIAASALRYIETGREHAAGSPDLPALGEERAWHHLRSVLRERLRRAVEA